MEALVAATRQPGMTYDLRWVETKEQLVNTRLVGSGFALLVAIAAGGGPCGLARAQGPWGGTIKGRVHLSGKLPGNPVIRMGMDPMCTKINAGKRVVQETVVVTQDGSLANVFVQLMGAFPATAMPTEAVTIDQEGCVYRPRVVGVRVGQPLLVRNSDDLMHNVHSLSAGRNGFSFSQPKAGMVRQVGLKDEETMLRLTCDIHRWMVAYIGIVSHPYFAVTDKAGTFEIGSVPLGSYSIQAWHERYGRLSQPVRVRSGAVATIDFTYTGNEIGPAL
jgi:hypothetical protein